MIAETTPIFVSSRLARKPNARRAAEINGAARLARKGFRNSNAPDYSFLPLPTFNGMACLCRALLLMKKPKGGEEGLTAGHGLEALGWRKAGPDRLPVQESGASEPRGDSAECGRP